MSDFIPAIISTFGVAFFWFIGAIPAGAALQLPVAVAALTAWASYVAGVAVIILLGAPLRNALVKRFNISLSHNPDQLFWRIWDRYGLAGLGLLAPITVGSQTAALIGMALGVKPLSLLVATAVGALIWSVVIALLLSLGISLI
ncbi:MAG: small multi-drug export protein [Chloroflexota bacterium]|nr:small multi-drug export protein [Chloroflexota bacterium]